MRRSVSLSTCALVLATAVACSVRTAEIRGPVTDETGKAVASARVTVMDAATGATREAKVNSRGWYSAVDLPPGTYVVRADAPGHVFGAVETVRVARGDTFTQDLWLDRVLQVPPPPAPLRAAQGLPVEIPDDLAIDLGIEGGVPGGVEGGVAGGVVGGVVGGLGMPALSLALSPDQRYVGPMNTEKYARIDETGFLDPRRDPLSTFSVDVDTASYANTRRFLNDGHLPPKDAVRIEEFLNYFAYDYPAPRDEAPFSVHTEVGPCPWSPRHRLVLVGLQGRVVPAEKLPPRNLVFLADVSGSMNEPRKLPLLRSALDLLATRLTAKDHVAIVVYAGSSGLALPRTRGDEKQVIRDAIARLTAGGSTNGAAGIQLAYQLAEEGFAEGAVNRVILATDGDFNVGITDPGALTRLIEEKRESGIFLSVLGFGDGNLQDATMESLADRGNGNYAYIDTLQEARKVLVREAGGTLVTIAKDVKLQVELNPQRIGAYRLIGYENRRLRDEDFKDDRKDAGEIGAGHRVTALYEIAPPDEHPDTGDVDPLKYQQATASAPAAASNELMTVKLRYKEPQGDESRPLTHVVLEPQTAGVGPSSELGFATAVAEFAMLLRASEHQGRASFESIVERARRCRGSDPDGDRGEFVRLVSLAEALATPPRATAERTVP